MKRISSEKGYTDSNIEKMDSFLYKSLESTNNTTTGPTFAHIEISLNGACTRRCVFCPRVDASKYPNLFESLDINQYTKMISSLKKNNFTGRLSFSGFCEPLLTKNINEYIYIAHSNLINMPIDIISNADCLPRKEVKLREYLDKLFCAGLSKLRISVYDGEEQFEEYKSTFERLGYNAEKIILRKRYLGPELNFGMTLSNRAGEIDIKNLGALYQGSVSLPLESPCYYPFYKLLVDFNGDVLICSHDWNKDKIVGNIHNEDIYSIWINDDFMKIRRMLMNSKRTCFPCSKCDVEGTLNGEQYFKLWESTTEN